MPPIQRGRSGPANWTAASGSRSAIRPCGPRRLVGCPMASRSLSMLFRTGRRWSYIRFQEMGEHRANCYPEIPKEINLTPVGRPTELGLSSAAVTVIPTPRSEYSTSGLIKFPHCRDLKAFSRPAGRPTHALSPPCPSIPAVLCCSISPPKSGKKSQR